MKKIIIGIILSLISNMGYAATKNFVPRSDNEGSLGTATTSWAAIVAEDVAVHDDLTVTDDVGVTGLVTITETLSVTGNSMLGAPGYKSTNTASSGAWAFPATVSIGGVLTQTGAANLDSTLDVDGNVIFGAAGYRSTFTAASGNADFAGTVDVKGLITNGTSASAKAVTLTDSVLNVQSNVESQTNPGSEMSLLGMYGKASSKAGTDMRNLQIVGMAARADMHSDVLDAYAMQSHLTISAGASSTGNMTAVSGKTVLGDSVSEGIVSAGLFTIEGTHGSAFTPNTGYGVWADIVDANLTAGYVLNANDSTVTAGLLFSKSGTGAITAEIKGQNSETLDNATDGSWKSSGGLVAAGGPMRLYSLTQAEIEALTPSVGDMYFCSDCTVTAVCIATGTIAGNSFQGVVNPATDCD